MKLKIQAPNNYQLLNKTCSSNNCHGRLGLTLYNKDIHTLNKFLGLPIDNDWTEKKKLQFIEYTFFLYIKIFQNKV